MSMIGFRLAFAWNIPIMVGNARPVRVASIPVLALLKMTAYLDRPLERERDLRDLSRIWHEYEVDGDGRFVDSILDAGVAFDEAGAFLLGRELSFRINQDERTVVELFLKKLEDENDRENTLDRMAFRGVNDWRARPEVYLACAASMRRGITGV